MILFSFSIRGESASTLPRAACGTCSAEFSVSLESASARLTRFVSRLHFSNSLRMFTAKGARALHRQRHSHRDRVLQRHHAWVRSGTLRQSAPSRPLAFSSTNNVLQESRSAVGSVSFTVAKSEFKRRAAEMKARNPAQRSVSRRMRRLFPAGQHRRLRLPQ